MAGLNIILNNTNLSSKTNTIKNSQSSLNGDGHISEVFRSKEDIFIGWNRYSDYPINSFETENYEIVIEGRVYNKTTMELINEICEIFNQSTFDNLSNWLLQADGDFLIYVYDKRNDTSYIFNDILGRLPLYFHISGNGIIISRHIRFITGLMTGFDFDRIALGEYLILGYMLGERTLFEDIRQLRPASIIIFSREKIEIKKIHEFNFDIRENKEKSFEENVSALSELLSEACLNRFNNGKTNLLALSSGLDSRTIAACLSKNEIPFESITMVYENGHGSEEVDVAKNVAEIFKVKWQMVRIPPPKGKHMYSLLEAKEGMNFLATAPILPFYEKLRNIYAQNLNFITGDKSDKISILYDIPVGKIKNIEDLIEHILSEHAMIGLDEASVIARLDKNEIIADFKKLLNSYPEKNFSQKYIHFRAIEKSHKLAFHGDDRHKRYIWSYCPLASSPFVIYGFNCPEKIKKLHRLFIGLMESYSPGIADILYTNFKAPITSLRAKLFMWGAYYIYPLLPTGLNNYIKNVFFTGNPFIDGKSVFYKCMERQFERTPAIRKYLNIPDVSYLKNYRMHMLSTFFTLTSLIEYFYGENSTFYEFMDTDFDYRKQER